MNSIKDNTTSNGEKTNYEYGKTSSYNLLVNSFINYFICDRVYLVAWIDGAYNVSDSKYRIKLTSTYERGSLSVTEKYGEICYAIKHAVVPKIGIGIKCTKRLSLEFCVFDQLTKIESETLTLYSIGCNFTIGYVF